MSRNHSRRALALALFAATPLLSSPARAGFPVYPPEPASGADTQSLMFFDDSDNADYASRCHNAGDGQVCVVGYMMPKGYSLAKNQNGKPMLTQGLFFSRQSWKNSMVVYNLTLEPDFGSATEYTDAIRKFKDRLSARYHVSADHIEVYPVETGAFQVIARNVYGSADTNPPALPSDPAPQPSPVASASPAPSASPSPSVATDPAAASQLGRKIAQGTYFTEIIVPQWSGNLHNVGSRFSISIRGPIWDLEPALQEMFLKEAGNAAVGSISFGIPVKAKAYSAKLKCNTRKLQDVFRSTLKTWSITRVRRGNSSWETFDNEEKNAIRNTLDMRDFCDIKEMNDTTLPGAELIRQRGQQIFQKMFDAAFQKITADGTPPQLIEGKDDRYTYFESSTHHDVSIDYEVNLSEDYVFYAKSDLDYYAGDVTEDCLDSAHKYLCRQFQKFDFQSNSCQLVCDPMRAVYMPGDPRGDSHQCVSLQDDPTGSHGGGQ